MRRDCDTCRYFNTDFDNLPCSVCSGCNRWEGHTNADHIRSMTDEELAKFLLKFASNVNSFRGRVIDWLKQPYKEEV